MLRFREPKGCQRPALLYSANYCNAFRYLYHGYYKDFLNRWVSKTLNHTWDINLATSMQMPIVDFDFQGTLSYYETKRMLLRQGSWSVE